MDGDGETYFVVSFDIESGTCSFSPDVPPMSRSSRQGRHHCDRRARRHQGYSL